MENRDLLIFAVVGLVLFIMWRRTEVALAEAQNQAAGIALGSGVVNLAGKAVETYFKGF
jgi:hypothetical protein